jgi:aryl-alcohol dehydrogenase-like predicted oxidoreductase
MQYTTLGASGLVVSRLVLGMMSYGDHSRRAWHLDLDEARPIVRRAVEAGVTVFDTADVYDRGVSEEVTGTLLRELFGSREEYVVATKVYYPMSERPVDRGLSRRHVLAAADASLRRLGTDHIDLYQIHRWDHATPIEETMEALDSLVRAGKIRYLGASSMYAWQLAKAQHVAERHGWHRFVSMQNHHNLAYREEEREMLPLCRDQGLGVLPYSPLARGLLTGSRHREGGGTTVRSAHDPAANSAYGPEDFDVVDALCEVADELARPPSQVALAWLRTRPGVTAPIVGATKLAHLEDALASLELVLDRDVVERLEAPYRPHAVSGPE